MHHLGWSLTASHMIVKHFVFHSTEFCVLLIVITISFLLLCLYIRRGFDVLDTTFSTSPSSASASVHIQIGVIQETTTIGRRRIFFFHSGPQFDSQKFEILTNIIRRQLQDNILIQRQGNHHDLRLRRMKLILTRQGIEPRSA
jgi:hypothetical protein